MTTPEIHERPERELPFTWLARTSLPESADRLLDVATDPRGNIVLLAEHYYEGMPSDAIWETSLTKFNSRGSVVWRRVWQARMGSPDSGAHRVAVAPSGAIYLSGTWSRDVNFGFGPRQYGTLVQFDADGVAQWQWKSQWQSWMNHLAASDSFVVVGTNASAPGIDYSEVALLASDGTHQWTRFTGGHGLGDPGITGSLNPDHVEVDEDGTVFVSGTAYGPTTVDGVAFSQSYLKFSPYLARFRPDGTAESARVPRVENGPAWGTGDDILSLKDGTFLQRGYIKTQGKVWFEETEMDVGFNLEGPQWMPWLANIDRGGHVLKVTKLPPVYLSARLPHQIVQVGDRTIVTVDEVTDSAFPNCFRITLAEVQDDGSLRTLYPSILKPCKDAPEDKISWQLLPLDDRRIFIAGSFHGSVQLGDLGLHTEPDEKSDLFMGVIELPLQAIEVQ